MFPFDDVIMIYVIGLGEAYNQHIPANIKDIILNSNIWILGNISVEYNWLIFVCWRGYRNVSQHNVTRGRRPSELNVDTFQHQYMNSNINKLRYNRIDFFLAQTFPNLKCPVIPLFAEIDLLVQERRNRVAIALELRLSCTNSSK